VTEIPEEARAAAALAAADRRWNRRKNAALVDALLADPEAERLRAEIRRAEEESGRELQPRYQALHDRYTAAEMDGDVDFLLSRCSGKHGQWGRICVLDDGHDRERDPLHWGLTAQGQPVAWIGSAPDDL
jgi:hypothetical protein